MTDAVWRSWTCHWVEPDSDGKPVHRTCSVDEAIQNMKAQTDYDSDQSALADFLSLHWAWVEK